MRLRYFLGGDRPSQTTHQTVSSAPIQGRELDVQMGQGGISLGGSPDASAPGSKPPTYATQAHPNVTAKL